MSLLKSISVSLVLIIVLMGCSGGHNRESEIKDYVIQVNLRTKPDKAKAYWELRSRSPQVKSVEKAYLGLTPYRGKIRLTLPPLNDREKDQLILVFTFIKKDYVAHIIKYKVGKRIKTYIELYSIKDFKKMIKDD